MAPNADSGSVKGPLITGMASIISALIGAIAAISIASGTGRLTTPSDTREFQRTKQESVRLLHENEGLKAERAGLQQEITGLKLQNATLSDEVAQTHSEQSSKPQAQEPPTADRTMERADDFVSQLDGCQKNTSGVTCVARIMNTKEDRVVRLYNDWTSIVDSTGNEQKAKVASLGASTNPYP